MTETLNAKDAENSIKSFKNIEAKVTSLIVTFSEFKKKWAETTEVCKYWNGTVEITKELKTWLQQIEKVNGTIIYKLLGNCCLFLLKQIV